MAHGALMPEYLFYWPDLGVSGWTAAIGVWVVAVVLIVLIGTPPGDGK